MPNPAQALIAGTISRYQRRYHVSTWMGRCGWSERRAAGGPRASAATRGVAGRGPAGGGRDRGRGRAADPPAAPPGERRRGPGAAEGRLMAAQTAGLAEVRAAARRASAALAEAVEEAERRVMLARSDVAAVRGAVPARDEVLGLVERIVGELGTVIDPSPLLSVDYLDAARGRS